MNIISLSGQLTLLIKNSVIMSNVTKFPINKTRPSGDGDKRLKFNTKAVLTSDE